MSKIFIKITHENAEDVVMICRKYRGDFDIDLKAGRHIIDATSMLGVFSLCSHLVQVVPIETDVTIIDKLFSDLQPLGAHYRGDNN